MTETKKYTPATMPPELTKTVLDMEAPRFDVAGNRVTGEHDQEVTPASGIGIIKVEAMQREHYTFDEFGGYFAIGVGIGMILLVSVG